MSLLGTIRLALWGASILFSAITLALAAHFTSITTRTYTAYTYIASYSYGGYYAQFAAMAIATSALTLLTLPVFIWIDKSRSGAFTSMIITEMIVVTILWILWLVTGSLTSNYTLGRAIGNCSSMSGTVATLCNEYKAIEAFSFLTFICLMGYGFTLLVFTLIAHNRGHSSVWTQSIKQTNFFAPPVNAPEGVVDEKAGGLSPAPQYQYPPVGSPYTAPGVLPPQQQQFQQPPFQQQPLQQQPFQQQQFQQPPPQGGYYPAGPPQPLQPQNTGPVAQPGFNQV